VSSSEAQWCSG